jgi:hypothetical protein
MWKNIFFISLIISACFFRADFQINVLGYFNYQGKKYFVRSMGVRRADMDQGLRFVRVSGHVDNVARWAYSFLPSYIFSNQFETLEVYRKTEIGEVFLTKGKGSICSQDSLPWVDLESHSIACVDLPFQDRTQEGSVVFKVKDEVIAQIQRRGWGVERKCKINGEVWCKNSEHWPVFNTENQPWQLNQFYTCDLTKKEAEAAFEEIVKPIVNRLPAFQLKNLSRCLEKLAPNSSQLRFIRELRDRRKQRENLFITER